MYLCEALSRSHEVLALMKATCEVSRRLANDLGAIEAPYE